MMGTTHAATGAAAGFGATCAYLTLTGSDPDIALLAAGTLTGAGAALLPDLDHPNSTAANSLGLLTQGVTWVLRALSRGAHALTRTRYDTGDGAHRALTHTLVFAVAVGALTGWSATCWPWVAWGVVWFTSSLALRSLTAHAAPGVRQRALSTWVAVSAGAAVLAWALVHHAGTSGWFLGAAVALGMAVHTLGDALTKESAPVLWPVKIRGKRWYDLALPSALRFSTGSPGEKWLAGVCWSVPVVGAVLVLP